MPSPIPTPWDDELIHTVDIWQFGPGQDADGGASGNYPSATYTGVICYVETESSEREWNEQKRVNLYNNLTIFFGANFGFKLNDQVQWTDSLSVTHKLFITGVIDMTPQGGMCEIGTEERV